MDKAQKSNISMDLKLFEWECSKKCTKEQRRWICITCGKFLLMSQMILYCSCESKKYSDTLLICHHPKYRPQESSKIGGNFHPSVPDTNEKQCPIVNPVNSLSSILQQLQEIQIRYEEDNDPKVFIVIISL